MKTPNRIAVIGLAAALVLAAFADFVSGSSEKCGVWAGDDFRKEFDHMTSTAEQCGSGEFNCSVNLPHWETRINVTYLSDGIKQEKVGTIRSVTRRALEEIEKETAVIAQEDSAISPNFLVFIMNDAMAKRLAQPDAKDIGFEAGSLQKMAYDRGKCSGLSWITPQGGAPRDQYQVIQAAAIFVYSDLEGEELEACVYEEIAGVTGIPNDPIASPSLFSNTENYTYDGIFRYSERLLLVFKAVYKIAAGEYKDIDEFCAAENR